MFQHTLRNLIDQHFPVLLAVLFLGPWPKPSYHSLAPINAVWPHLDAYRTNEPAAILVPHSIDNIAPNAMCPAPWPPRMNKPRDHQKLPSPLLHDESRQLYGCIMNIDRDDDAFRRDFDAWPARFDVWDRVFGPLTTRHFDTQDPIFGSHH